MHYYKRNLGDYAKKAGRLTMLQHGAYTLLIDACYDREQFPTRDEAINWAWASSTAEVEAVDFVLSKFFVLEDGRYVQNRIREEIAAYQALSETNKRIATNRPRSVHGTWSKRGEDNHGASTERPEAVHERPPNHKPLTNNQEPITKKPLKPSRSLTLPEWLDREVWANFVKHRGSKFTDNAQELAIQKLDAFRHRGHDPTAIINESIANGWKGLFEPKGGVTSGYVSARDASRKAAYEGLTGRKSGTTYEGSGAVICEDDGDVRGKVS